MSIGMQALFSPPVITSFLSNNLILCVYDKLNKLN